MGIQCSGNCKRDIAPFRQPLNPDKQQLADGGISVCDYPSYIFNIAIAIDVGAEGHDLDFAAIDIVMIDRGLGGPFGAVDGKATIRYCLLLH